MDLKDIQNLIRFVSKSEVKEVDLEFENVKIKVVNNDLSHPTIAQPIANQNLQIAVPQAITPIETTPNISAEIPKNEDTSKYLEIKSPMIGTFYRCSGPEKPAFVNVGDEIQTGKIVCMIEAMKLFNEIESEISGRIVKILVEDASPVEYNQPLFLVDPN